MTKKQFKEWLENNEKHQKLEATGVKSYNYENPDWHRYTPVGINQYPKSEWEIDDAGNLYANIGGNRYRLHNPLITNIEYPMQPISQIKFQGSSVNIPSIPNTSVEIRMTADYIEEIGPALELDNSYLSKQNEIWSDVFN